MQEIIDNLSLITNVIPDYTEGRRRGLSDEETGQLALDAVFKAMEILRERSR